MDLGAGTVAALPGRTILIDPDVLATATPGEVAGRAASALEGDAVAALVRDAGILADIRYVFGGHLGERAVARAAESAASAPPTTVAGREAHATALADSDWIALRAICG
jgi:hypothetical protein